MTTFSFSTGNPTNLTGGATASMTDISGSLTDLKTFLNAATITDTNVQAAGLTDTSLASPANVVWRTVAAGAGGSSSIIGQITTTPAWFSAGGSTNASGASANNSPQGLWTPPPAGDINVAGKTTRLRLRVVYLVNATAPGITITWGLYPVTPSGGGASTVALTLGTVIAGSTAAVVTPAIGASGTVTGASFDLSAVSVGTNYVLGVVGSGTQAASSHVSTAATLEMRHT